MLMVKRIFVAVLLASTATTCAGSGDLSAFIGTWQVKVAPAGDDPVEFRLTIRDEDDGVSVHAKFNSESASEPRPAQGCYSKHEGGILTASVSGDAVQAKADSLRTYLGDTCKAEGVDPDVQYTHTSGDMKGKRTKGGDGLNGTWKVDLFDWSCASSIDGGCTEYKRKEEVETSCELEIRSLVDADISMKCDDGGNHCTDASVEGSLNGDRFEATVTFSECSDKFDIVKITAERQ